MPWILSTRALKLLTNGPQALQGHRAWLNICRHLIRRRKVYPILSLLIVGGVLDEFLCEVAEFCFKNLLQPIT